jgi:hypothetical protein
MLSSISILHSKKKTPSSTTSGPTLPSLRSASLFSALLLSLLASSLSLISCLFSLLVCWFVC